MLSQIILYHDSETQGNVESLHAEEIKIWEMR